MKNKFIAILVGMLLCITSCRTDETLNQEKRTSTEKIAVFEKFEKLHSEELLTKKQLPALQLSYGEPFAELIKNFLMKHPDYEKQINEAVGEIRMDVVSQTIGKEEKTLIFPVTDSKGTVTAAWLGTVNKNRDYVKFYCLNNASKEVQIIIGDFQKYYDRVPGRSQKIKEKEIEEVVITIINPYPSSDMPWWVFDYNPSVGAGGGDGLGSGMDGGYQEHARGEGSYNNKFPDYMDPNDPCAKAKVGVNKANTTLADARIKADFTDKMKNIAASSTNSETGMTIGKDSNGNIKVSDPFSVSGTAGQVPAAPAGYNALADGHNHNSSSPPSPGDLWTMMEKLVNNPYFETRYVFGQDGSIYALTVNNRQAAIDFLAAYPRSQYLKPNSGDFIQDSNLSIYKDYYETIDKLTGYTPFMSQIDATKNAMAYIMDKYGMGISLSKSNGTKLEAVNAQKNTDGTFSTSTCN